MKLVNVLLIAGSLAVLSSCAYMPNGTAPGYIYADAKGYTAVTDNKAGAKHGQACSSSILGWIGMGDASTKAAAAKGGITKVATVDTAITNILGLYATYCTSVTGE